MLVLEEALEPGQALALEPVRAQAQEEHSHIHTPVEDPLYPSRGKVRVE